MSSAYGSIARPLSDKSLNTVLPRHATLKGLPSKENASTLFRITAYAPSASESTYTLSSAAHPSLLRAMKDVFNTEVERGDTYPQEFELSGEQFENYFFSGDAFVLLKGQFSDPALVPVKDDDKDWHQDMLGFFYVKPNFPICNGGFIVNPVHRGQGIGGILGRSFLEIVPIIGYKASMFNLVFVSNTASIRLWRRLGFKEIGRIPKAGRLRGQGAQEQGQEGSNEGFVDAIQFYWDFETMPVLPL